MMIAKKRLALPGVLTLMAVACGGASPAAETSGTVDSTSAPESSAAQATAAPPTPAAPEPAATSTSAAPVNEPVGGSSSGESYAKVTIDGQTYDFAPAPGNALERCDSNFFGGFWVLFVSGVQITLPGPNWEAQGRTDPAAIEVTLPDDTEWSANADAFGVQPGQSQVDSYEILGTTASGTATFVDTTNFGAEMTPVSGSFEAYCANSTDP